MAEIIAVISSSGGIGKSFFACNMAIGLRSMTKKVLLSEISFGKVSHDVILGVTPDTLYNIADVLTARCSPADAVNSPEDSLLPDYISASPAFFNGSISEKSAKSLLSDNYDYVILDVQSSDSIAYSQLVESADTVLVLSDDSFLSVRNTSLIVKSIKSDFHKTVYLVLNKVLVDENPDSVCVEDIIDEISCPLIGIIPYDEHALYSILKSLPIYRYRTYASKAIENICHRIIKSPVSAYETGIANGIFSRNKNRFIPR